MSTLPADTLRLHGEKNDSSRAGAALSPNIQAGPVVETGDGFVVVSRKLATVLPPYQWQYSLEHFDRLDDATDHYADHEHGEYPGWEPVAIVVSLKGVPLGSKVILSNNPTPAGPACAKEAA